jgi:uncharacterized protein (DUF2141 family)
MICSACFGEGSTQSCGFSSEGKGGNYEINKNGYRGEYFSPPKPQGGLRISGLLWEAPIYLHVYGIRNALGTVKAILYGPKPEDFWIKGKKIDKEREPAQKESMTICVAAPEEGQ